MAVPSEKTPLVPPRYIHMLLYNRQMTRGNITTAVIHSYEYSPTIDNSTIKTYTNRGLGK